MRKATGDAMLHGTSSEAFSHPCEYLSEQTINPTLPKIFICFWFQASARKDPLGLIMLCTCCEIHRGFVQN